MNVYFNSVHMRTRTECFAQKFMAYREAFKTEQKSPTFLFRTVQKSIYQTHSDTGLMVRQTKLIDNSSPRLIFQYKSMNSLSCSERENQF